MMKHQIATTTEQSKRLIACGVNPDSADMLLYNNALTVQVRGLGKIPDCATPSWSLSALLSLLPMEIRKDGIDFDMMLKAYPNEQECYRWCISYYDMELEATAYYSEAPDPIEACVRIVRTLTDNGYTLNMK